MMGRGHLRTPDPRGWGFQASGTACPDTTVKPSPAKPIGDPGELVARIVHIWSLPLPLSPGPGAGVACHGGIPSDAKW